MKEKIKKREKNKLYSFFKRRIELEPLKLKREKIEFLRKKGLGIHYLPSVQYKDFPQEEVSDFFISLREKGVLKPQSLKINPGWILIETEPKPEKEGPWLRKNFFFDFLDKLGANSRSLCGLAPSLKFEGWGELGKRQGATRKEISSKFLKKKGEQIDLGFQMRLPYYLEYVYLGKNFYQDWGKTETWEWLQDGLEGGNFLAAGCRDASRLGADPKNHWSSILGFRLLVQLKK